MLSMKLNINGKIITFRVSLFIEGKKENKTFFIRDKSKVLFGVKVFDKHI
jgi:hypothetical protein